MKRLLIALALILAVAGSGFAEEKKLAPEKKEVKEYYKSGKVKWEIIKIDSKRDRIVLYFENGNMQQEVFRHAEYGDYLNKYYWENGKLKSECSMTDGDQEGIEITYFDNGILRSESMYVNGKLDGTAIFYDMNGKIIRKEEYETGILVGSLKYRFAKIWEYLKIIFAILFVASMYYYWKTTSLKGIKQ